MFWFGENGIWIQNKTFINTNYIWNGKWVKLHLFWNCWAEHFMSCRTVLRRMLMRCEDSNFIPCYSCISEVRIQGRKCFPLNIMKLMTLSLIWLFMCFATAPAKGTTVNNTKCRGAFTFYWFLDAFRKLIIKLAIFLALTLGTVMYLYT